MWYAEGPPRGMGPPPSVRDSPLVLLPLRRSTEARVQSVPQGVAQEVDREDGREDRDPRASAHPPLEVREVSLRVVDVLAPRRVRRLRAETEERQRRLREDRESRGEGRLDDERVRHVREDVPQHDPQR